MPRYTNHQLAAFRAIQGIFGKPLAEIAVADLVPARGLAYFNEALKAGQVGAETTPETHRRALYQAWLISPMNPASPAHEAMNSARDLINSMRRRGYKGK